MAVTPTSLKAKFSALSDADDADLQVWIDEAELNVCRSSWGDRADDGVSYLAAHLYFSFNDASSEGASGPVTEKKVDQLSASYQVGDIFSDWDMGTTKFGRRFIGLRRLIFAARVI